MTTTPLDPEIQELEGQLGTDPRYIRLKQLKRMRQDYLALPSAVMAAAALKLNGGDSASVAAEGGTAEAKVGRRRSPEREQALAESKKLLTGKAEPTRTADIDVHLERLGIRLGGTDPLNNLSALLSTSGEFRSHGRAGWTYPT